QHRGADRCRNPREPESSLPDQEGSPRGTACFPARCLARARGGKPGWTCAPIYAGSVNDRKRFRKASSTSEVAIGRNLSRTVRGGLPKKRLASASVNPASCTASK